MKFQIDVCVTLGVATPGRSRQSPFIDRPLRLNLHFKGHVIYRLNTLSGVGRVAVLPCCRIAMISCSPSNLSGEQWTML